MLNNADERPEYMSRQAQPDAQNINFIFYEKDINQFCQLGGASLLIFIRTTFEFDWPGSSYLHS